jgi:hypothetical protein
VDAELQQGVFVRVKDLYRKGRRDRREEFLSYVHSISFSPRALPARLALSFWRASSAVNKQLIPLTAHDK